MFALRVLRSRDVDQLAAFYYWTLFVSEGEKSPPWDIMQQAPFQYYLQDWGRSGDIGFLLESHTEKQLIGMAWFRLFDGHHAGFGFVAPHIPELVLAVHPAYRSQGVGSELLDKLIRQARIEGFSGLSLSVHPKSPAVRLYQRYNFKWVCNREPLQVMQVCF